jgi:hypothetical protein
MSIVPSQTGVAVHDRRALDSLQELQAADLPFERETIGFHLLFHAGADLERYQYMLAGPAVFR